MVCERRSVGWVAFRGDMEAFWKPLFASLGFSDPDHVPWRHLTARSVLRSARAPTTSNLSQSVSAIPLSREADTRDSGTGSDARPRIASTATAAVRSPDASFVAGTLTRSRPRGRMGTAAPSASGELRLPPGRVHTDPRRVPRPSCPGLGRTRDRNRSPRCSETRLSPIAGPQVRAPGRPGYLCMRARDGSSARQLTLESRRSPSWSAPLGSMSSTSRASTRPCSDCDARSRSSSGR